MLNKKKKEKIQSKNLNQKESNFIFWDDQWNINIKKDNYED